MAQVANLCWQATAKLNLSAEVWGQWDWDPSGTTRQATADGAVASAADGTTFAISAEWTDTLPG